MQLLRRYLKGPSQPHLYFCIQCTCKSLAIVCYSEQVEMKEITVKLLKIIKRTSRNTTYSKFHFPIEYFWSPENFYNCDDHISISSVFPQLIQINFNNDALDKVHHSGESRGPPGTTIPLISGKKKKKSQKEEKAAGRAKQTPPLPFPLAQGLNPPLSTAAKVTVLLFQLS